MKSYWFIYFLLTICLASCSANLSVDGFDKEKWKNAPSECADYRLEKAQLLVEKEKYLLARTQNEIESLLGQAEEHELYKRNQKFFHYRLSLLEKCDKTDSITTYLSIRFNALGRSSNIQIFKRKKLEKN